MTAQAKEEAYVLAQQKVFGLTEGETDTCLKMASLCAILKQALPYLYWVGFYRVTADDKNLIIGPYQGTPACLHIPFDKGVCGTAASTLETQLVADVHSFPGHIACDPASQSELVIPIINTNEELIAVLDLDSDRPSAFCETDKSYLESICSSLFSDAKRF